MNPYEILLNNENYAVVGVSPNRDKYAYKIYTLLKNKGKKAFGVHPTIEKVDEDTVYPTLESIPTDVDIAVFVVKPQIGLTYLSLVAEKGIKTIWLQPGTINDELLTKADELGLTVIQDCVLAQYARNESK